MRLRHLIHGIRAYLFPVDPDAAAKRQAIVARAIRQRAREQEVQRLSDMARKDAA